MLNTYNVSSQTVAINSPINLGTASINTCPLNISSNGTQIAVSRPGYYFVGFNATAEATGTATDPITIQLYNGEDVVPGASASELSEAVGNSVNLSFGRIVKVAPSCCAVNNSLNLTVKNTGIAANFTNLNMVVFKI